MRYAELTEAKFAQPVIMYHGTSSALLRSILKHGMQPDPKQRVWATDTTSVVQASRKSLPGSYWTSNLITATGSAHTAKQKLGGDNELLVVAQIMEASAVADEDSINGAIEWAFEDMNRAVNPGVVPNAVGISASAFFSDDHYRERMRQAFTDALHKHLKGAAQQPVNQQLADEVLDAYFMRKLSYGGEEYWMRRIGDRAPTLPSPAEAEERFLRAKERLTHSYRHTTYRRNERFNHTLRITTAVTFSGANKIIGIFELLPYQQVDGSFRSPPLILHYGRVAEKLIADWEERKGPFPGVVDRQGREIMPARDRQPR